MKQTIRIVLADDHPVVIAGVKALLSDVSDVKVVGEAIGGNAALSLVKADVPDVAIVDISLTDMTGIELTRELKRDCPSVHVLALTAHEERAYLNPMLQAGARGYLLKRSAAEELARAVRIVAGGGVYLDPAIAEKVLVGAGRENGSDLLIAGLSSRETETLKLIAQGVSNKEISTTLNVSARTVETYRARALAKLGLRTRADIVRFVASQGWLTDICG